MMEDLEHRLISFVCKELQLTTTDSVGLDTRLFSSQLMDSIGLVGLMSYILDELQVRLAPEDMTVENIDTVRSLAAFIRERAQNQS